MSSVKQKSQEPGVYVMQSVAKAKRIGRKQEKPGCYVVQAKRTANAIAGTTELIGDFSIESGAVRRQDEPGIYVVQAKTPTCALVWELDKELNNGAASSQYQEYTRQNEEKIQYRRAKYQCT